MDERSRKMAADLLRRLPWQRAPHSLVTPLVELVGDEAVSWWDSSCSPDPRAYGATIVVFTRTRLLVHTVQHRRGDRRAAVSTEVHLRRELMSVTSSSEPVTRRTAWDWLCDALGRGRPVVEAPRARQVDLRFARLEDPLTLPLSWDAGDPGRNAAFDRFVTHLVDDLP